MPGQSALLPPRPSSHIALDYIFFGAASATRFQILVIPLRSGSGYGPRHRRVEQLLLPQIRNTATGRMLLEHLCQRDRGFSPGPVALPFARQGRPATSSRLRRPRSCAEWPPRGPRLKGWWSITRSTESSGRSSDARPLRKVMTTSCVAAAVSSVEVFRKTCASGAVT
jgi:hypothetical protein